MAGIIEFSQVVQEALRDHGYLFANEPQRRHFVEYLTGLYGAARKTVAGINAELARTGDPSCLNRFVQLESRGVQELNRRRPDLLQPVPATRYIDHGTTAVDNTLIDPIGQLIDDVGRFQDHADERFAIACAT